MPDNNARIRLASPDLGEEELDAVRRVLRSGVLTNGPENEAFGQEFADRHRARFGVTFCTGTAALNAMLLAEGIGPGDEVIVPSMTFVSTATAVCHVGARPVFADIDPQTFNLDPAVVASRLTPATRAVLTVHYAGQPGDLDALAGLCAEAGVSLLEDAAQAAGAEYRCRPVGTFGRSAMFSFTPTKNITTGEGGIVLTDDPDVAERLKLLRNHGQTGLYRHESLGHNWRLTEMQAAIGRVQLRRLDGILERKRAIAESLTRRLAGVPGLTTPYQAPEARGTWMLYTCLLPKVRDRVLADLLGRGIEARVYFPPVHRQPLFARCGAGGGAIADGGPAELPVTEAVAEAMLSVPVHHRLTEADVAEIADAVIAAVGRAAAAPPGAVSVPSAAVPAGRASAAGGVPLDAVSAPKPVGDR
ncbi:DegT/DnrJ/EryC1/StrS family aminotransferase [Kitasatospora sp. DSM 101779]|uniref:DegT/DnrJ/EryC1/StrS family aminotransferase n=1 Tax=Kitasatospora sp. DSM 101779 TaxID=2853165 RepID=UPI0021D8AD5B|nr:DegT/DnrJ/EryC1/StrS family aminotransferase [Kitasatospora sp. DSM 101779]MCU7827151.1 DegT/DnrJ/EryC1/StrS family aminotransferase [Kitasatospora sp. DSM 101779]